MWVWVWILKLSVTQLFREPLMCGSVERKSAQYCEQFFCGWLKVFQFLSKVAPREEESHAVLLVPLMASRTRSRRLQTVKVCQSVRLKRGHFFIFPTQAPDWANVAIQRPFWRKWRGDHCCHVRHQHEHEITASQYKIPHVKGKEKGTEWRKNRYTLQGNCWVCRKKSSNMCSVCDKHR